MNEGNVILGYLILTGSIDLIIFFIIFMSVLMTENSDIIGEKIDGIAGFLGLEKIDGRRKIIFLFAQLLVLGPLFGGLVILIYLAKLMFSTDDNRKKKQTIEYRNSDRLASDEDEYPLSDLMGKTRSKRK
jgi:hypothetical protein